VDQPDKKYILFVEAHPRGSTDVRSNTEYRKIKEMLDKSQNRQYDLIPVLSTRYIDLQEALEKYKPSIVHFSGHGTKSGGLCLEDSQGNPMEISLDNLAELLGNFSIECVVLNACYTQLQSSNIKRKITYVLIGTTSTISPEAAIDFAESFYQSLFNGEDYERAFKLGQNRLRVEHPLDYRVIKCLSPKN
jgi:hypothetical protein